MNLEIARYLSKGAYQSWKPGFCASAEAPGPIIELAADASLIDIADPISGCPFHERLAYRFGEQYVDATLAVSDYLAAYARRYDRPVSVIHPFVEAERFDRLHALEPGGDGETILCVGKHRHKNGQDVLRDAMRSIDDGRLFTSWVQIPKRSEAVTESNPTGSSSWIGSTT